MNKKQTIYAFIDSQNLNLGIKSVGWELDFKKFRRYLKDKYGVKKAFIFIGYMPGNGSLYTYLQNVGYIIIFKPLIINSKDLTKIKGNVDGELILHTMIEYENYDKAIIVSGDGDFHCLIEYLDEKCKLFKVLTPNNRFSSLLRKFAKYITPIPLFRHKVEKKRDIPADK